MVKCINCVNYEWVRCGEIQGCDFCNDKLHYGILGLFDRLRLIIYGCKEYKLNIYNIEFP
jgi:hypothetical protein